MSFPVGGARDNLMSQAQLTPIVESLESIAAKKELRVRSAYQIFVTEKLQENKKGKGGDCKSFKEAGNLWKTMTAKQKEPYMKTHADDQAKANAVKKEWGKTFDKHWNDLEKHLEAEEELCTERIKKRVTERKEKATLAKKMKQDKKKHLAGSKKRRAPLRASSFPGSAPARTSSGAEIARLSKGLDTDVWEVRESTRNVGFFYYFNKRTRQSMADRPKNARGAPAAKSTAKRSRTQ